MQSLRRLPDIRKAMLNFSSTISALALLGGCIHPGGAVDDEVRLSAEKFSELLPSDLLKKNSFGICRETSNVPTGVRLGGVMDVLGHDALFRLSGSETCGVEIKDSVADLSLPMVTSFEECHIALKQEKNVVVRIQFAASKPDKVSYQKCMFRVGLWSLGRSEYFVMPSEKLFIGVEHTRFWGLPGMPEVIPDIELPDSRKRF